MKSSIKKFMGLALVLGSIAVGLSGCYETRYVHHYNHHTRGWYDRRHTPPPAGVNFEVDVYKRRY